MKGERQNGHKFLVFSIYVGVYMRLMEKLQKRLYWAIIASEASHVFCCVLPTMFSVLSLFVGLGVVGVMPGWLENIHEALHNWELPIIAFSGAVIAFGWSLDAYSRKVDCHNTGCHHGPCEGRKKRAHSILKAATILFIVNVTVYAVLHRGLELGIPTAEIAQEDNAH